MIKVILARLQQKYRTMKYPAGDPPALPDRFRGRPEIEPSACPADCDACAAACPTGAASRLAAAKRKARKGSRELPVPDPRIDLGKCLFCGDCAAVCPRGAISFTCDYRLAVRSREALLVSPGDKEIELAEAFGVELKRLYGRSFKLRQLSAGGCGACEADSNVLTTIGWDISRFGIQFVASPRHADGLLVTGPVTKNMELALRKTYEAMAEPKIVIAVGSCAISGGPYIGSEAVLGGASSLELESGRLPVDLFVPGCPPHPLTILDGLLRLLGRIEKR
jgi:Ni,Fe-hydrogenase III small subunit/formate hydrogenlyase subunit 6/NADH:ubiquinone oxidoreductase subunit I